MPSWDTVKHWLKSRQVILILLLIVAVGSFLRFYDLGAESIWVDEAAGIDLSAYNSVGYIIENVAPTQNHPPFYFILLNFWINLFGTGEIATRSLSAIFGIISILLIYQIGSLLFNRRVGLISGILSTISCYHIYYSQEARSYSLLLLLSLLSYFFFIKILKEGKNWYYLCYFLTCLFLGYTHVYGLFIMASQALFFLLFWGKYRAQRIKFATTMAVNIVALLPLVFLLGERVVSISQHGFWITEPTLSTVENIFALYSGYDGGQAILLGVFSLCGVIGILSIWRVEGEWVMKRPLESLKGLTWRVERETFQEILLLALWLSCTIVIPFVMSKVTTPILIFRYTIGASPAFYLLVARGMDTLKWKRLLPAILVAIIIIVSSFGLYSYYKEDVKPEWRETASFIEDNSREDDVIIIYQSYRQTPFDYYYRGDLPEYGIRQQASAQEVTTMIDSVVSGSNRLWFIVRQGSGAEQMLSYLKNNYGSSIVLEQNFSKVSVFLLELSAS